MDFVFFNNKKELENFLGKIQSKKLGKIEYGILENFYKNKILFTAEHAYHARVKTPEQKSI